MSHAEPWDLPFEVKLMIFITRILVGAVLGGVCVVGVLWFLGQPKFDIAGVRVQNESELRRVNALALEQITMNRIDGNFFTLRLDEVKATVESMPWVKRADVQRVWPYQLSVRVEEHVPVALLGGTLTTVQLLDTEGEIFEVAREDVTQLKLPTLDGPIEKSVATMMWDFYLQIEPLMRGVGMDVEILGLSEHGIWSMRLVNGANIIIGRGATDVLLKRVNNFVKTAPTALSPYGGRALIRADLRYSSGYALEVAGVQIGEPATGRRMH